MRRRAAPPLTRSLAGALLSKGGECGVQLPPGLGFMTLCILPLASFFDLDS